MSGAVFRSLPTSGLPGLLSFSANNLQEKILISITSLHWAYWSRGWYVRRHPCNKAHHWSRFCCDSFFSWILLKYFRHCFRVNCGTKMADIEQVQMIPFVWNFFWLEYLRAGFWCRCIWFGFLGPSWFDRTTNQAQLCGSLKNVSLWDFFPLMIILITASLSSNTYNKVSWCEDWTFEGTQSIWFNTLVIPRDFWFSSVTTGLPGLSLVWIVFPRTETIRSHKSRAQSDPINREQESSDFVELCESEVCFLHIHLIGTNVWLPKIHKIPSEVDFESSRSPAKSES